MVAEADPNALEEEIIERPPSLTPAAARKLVDLAGRFAATLETAAPTGHQASVPAGSQGL
ncbi:hypothetical protein D3C87_2106150 [compost metagenome]